MSEPSLSARPAGKRSARGAQGDVHATLSDGLFLLCAAFTAVVGGVMLTAALAEEDVEWILVILHVILGIPFSLGGGAAWLVSAMRKPADPLSPFLRWPAAAMLALPWTIWLLSASHVF